MKNVDVLRQVIEVIEDNLNHSLSLAIISNEIGYSQYHIHRLFSSVVGISMNQYIIRRRITESARELIESDSSILSLALEYGYHSQQAYTDSFRRVYGVSPHKFRKRGTYYPNLLRFNPIISTDLRVDNAFKVRKVDVEDRLLVGYKANMNLGFLAIPLCMKRLLKRRNEIGNNGVDVIAYYDYSEFSMDGADIKFQFYALQEVDGNNDNLKGMSKVLIKGGSYIVFSFYGNPEKSLEPVWNYIYKEWLVQSNVKLSDTKHFDFTRNSPTVDEHGECLIEYWLPIES